MSSRLRFIRQQGFFDATAQACPTQYPALMFQPRVIGVLVLVGLVLQAWSWFLALSILLWWNVLVPALNPFDALYNVTIARRQTRPPLTPAPGPRRFAQAMAATFALAVALLLSSGHLVAAYVVEAVLLVAVGALVLGRFCLGSFLFLLLKGEGRFARRTLPWSADDRTDDTQP